MSAPTIVQHKSGFLSGVSTLTVTLTSAVLAGSMIVVFIGTASGATGSGQCIVNTPTMTGETLAKITGASNVGTSGNGQVACYATNSAVGGHTAVVVTLSGTSGVSDLHMHVIEISGQAASPQDATGNTQSTTASVSTSGATTTATDLVLAFFFDFALNHTITAGAGYATVEQTNDVATGDVGYSESKTVAATGTQTATCTGTSTDTIEAGILAIAGAASASVSTSSDDGDAQLQRFSQTSRMESQHQQELSETFAILPQRPPFAYEDDGANIRWSDWRALLHEDPETHRALPPVPPVSIQEEFTESVWVDWRARQFEDTDTHRALPPTPPFAIQDEHADEKNFNWSAIQYEDAETQRVLPPTPPLAIQDEVSERGLPGIVPFFEEDQAPKPIVAAAAPNIGLDDAEAHIKAYDRVNMYHEDDLSTFAPTPPVSIQDDEQHTWRAWSSAAIEDDWRALPPTPPFVVPDDTAEKWTATSAPAIEDDQATIPPVPPVVPFSIQDDEQHSWRGWLSPHIEADWTTAAPVPPLAFEEDLKTISSNPVFFSLVETDLVGIPPLPRFFGDDEQSLQRYMVAGLSGLILLDDFVNAPIATGLGPFTLTSLSASVRPGIDSLGAAVRSSMESEGAVIRPGIDSLSAAIRASMESKGAAVRPGIDSTGAIVRPS